MYKNELEFRDLEDGEWFTTGGGYLMVKAPKQGTDPEYPSRNATKIPSGLPAVLGPLAPVTRADPAEIPVQVCRSCGFEYPITELRRVTIYTSVDEAGEPDPAGSFTESNTEYQCCDEATCRETRATFWELEKQIQRHNDAAAREDGWGVIGGPARQ